MHNTFHLSTPDEAYTCDSTPAIKNYSHFKAVIRAWCAKRSHLYDRCVFLLFLC